MNEIKITYASDSEHSFAQRLIIKTIERATGRKKLEKIYKEYAEKINDPKFFWSAVLEIMDIKVTNKSKNKLEIPNSGPLLMISNHPFGIIDGLILCSLASKIRNDFKIITHETLKLIPELDDFILPIDFSGTNKKIIKNNIKTTQEAKNHLLNNGLLIIFPSGSVSVAKDLKTAAEDDEWKIFSAKLIHQTKTDVLPIYFEGKNGFLFHLFASKIKNQTLKYSSYIHETRRKIGKEIIIYSGELIKYESIESIKDRSKLTEYLKNITYNLKK
tara:strand:+ start:139 stop:957 length:819 start_codon:yes stop_codon:yes gene_type:complete